MKIIKDYLRSKMLINRYLHFPVSHIIEDKKQFHCFFMTDTAIETKHCTMY